MPSDANREPDDSAGGNHERHYPEPFYDDRAEQERVFPYNSVAGVLDDRAALDRTMDALRQAGFPDDEVHVLSGQAGIDQIDELGQHRGMLNRLFHFFDNLGGNGDQSRQVEELRAGHYLVVVETPDDIMVPQVRDAMVEHQGHFINYYSKWSSVELVP